MINLSKIDLNLLVVLDALLEERSVTRTAERLHLTQSAVSHALRRLRVQFDDELFVRDGRQMVPTKRAQGLAGKLPNVLLLLQNTLTEPADFEPSTSIRKFRLAGPDFIASLLPLLLQEVAMAPGIQIELIPISSRVVQELANGRYDALIAPTGIPKEGLRGELLGAWPWVVFGKKNHPAFTNWSIDSWSAAPHLRIGSNVMQGEGPIDKKVSKIGIKRVVGAVIPNFSMSASILANTNMLLTVPSLTMGDSAAAYNLESRDIPFDLPPLELSLFRSAVMGDDPSVKWFIERIFCALNQLNEKNKGVKG